MIKTKLARRPDRFHFTSVQDANPFHVSSVSEITRSADFRRIMINAIRANQTDVVLAGIPIRAYHIIVWLHVGTECPKRARPLTDGFCAIFAPVSVFLGQKLPKFFTRRNRVQIPDLVPTDRNNASLVAFARELLRVLCVARLAGEDFPDHAEN